MASGTTVISGIGVALRIVILLGFARRVPVPAY
jgi:hypothetical protein